MKRLFFIFPVFATLISVLSISCGWAQEYEFVFNPPLGIEYIETTVSKERLSMNEEKSKTEETNIKARYFVEDYDSNILITTEAISIEYLVNGESANKPLIDFMENQEYQLEVNKDGQLVGIYGIEGVLDSMYSQYDPEVRELMSQFFNEDILYAVIIDEWNKSTADFVGKKFSLGDKWTVVDTMQLLIGSLAIIEKTITFAEILECGNNQCVRIKIEYAAEPDIPEEAFMEFLASIMNTKLEDSLNAEIRGFKMYGVEERIISPATMMVYSEYGKKITEFEIITQTEGTISFRKEEIDESQFEYFLEAD